MEAEPLDWEALFRSLPVGDIPSLMGRKVSWYAYWLAHPLYDDYWKKLSVAARYEQIKAAAFNLGGLYDIFVEGTLENFSGMRQRGGSEAALNGQRLGPRSAIKCSGRLIQVDGVTIPSPFTFLAIGDKSRLMSALNIRGGVLDGLRLVQFQVKLTPKDEIVLPPVAIAPKYQYARPVTQEQSP